MEIQTKIPPKTDTRITQISKENLASACKLYRQHVRSLPDLYSKTTERERSMNLAKISRGNPEAEDFIRKNLISKIVGMNEFYNVVRPMNEDQIRFTAEMILSEYGRELLLVDVELFFRKLISGQLSVRILDRIDGNVILQGLKEYLDMKEEARHHAKMIEHQQLKYAKPDHNKVDKEGLERLAKMIGSMSTKRPKEASSRYTSLMHYCECTNQDYLIYIKQVRAEADAYYEKLSENDKTKVDKQNYTTMFENQILYNLNKSK
jgi:hypothetical protein